MATRSIVTSQPDVACEICGRRLLRGEQPEFFLAGGQRRTVCELCAPRAAYEGWLRESDEHPVGSGALRSRRGRTLLDRLRQLRESSSTQRARPVGAARQPVDERGERYEFRGGEVASTVTRAQAFFEESFDQPHYDQQQQPLAADDAAAPPSNAELKLARALEVFNASEQPRRLAGVARSLGPAWVTLRLLDESSSRVSIVVAWELCWYRYEVDLAEEAAGAVPVAQGTEIDELPAEDLTANAVADERGELTLA